MQMQQSSGIKISLETLQGCMANPGQSTWRLLNGHRRVAGHIWTIKQGMTAKLMSGSRLQSFVMLCCY